MAVRFSLGGVVVELARRRKQVAGNLSLRDVVAAGFPGLTRLRAGSLRIEGSTSPSEKADGSGFSFDSFNGSLDGSMQIIPDTE